ncbi:MAG: four helix bundle protein [Elusimicrobiota bacterium]|nr:four helix bundle protein [Endomicrobiia bacterium]MCX7940749.1 four helix bundle protein [Endomicrobiia bacterium]MDW8055152.1 four helix bundle protein [Elusimicrobiota bacterium]MDW8166804.1 four helix bundle protein [Elusimicrobiota bacterium]
MRISRFEEIKAWQNAKELTLKIYRTCTKEKFKNDGFLLEQIKRSSVSIMANIAEGFARQTNKEFIQFLFIAKASSAELQSHLHLAFDLKYISNNEFVSLYDLCEVVQKQMSGLIKYLKSNL